MSSYRLDIPTMVGGALALTAALAWNEVAKSGIQSLYPQPTGSSFKATLVYAVVVTILIIFVFAVLRAVARVDDPRHNENQKTPGPATAQQKKRRRPPHDTCAPRDSWPG